jgi:hypothetical protein
MSKIYSPRIVQDSLVMCLDASNNKSYPTDLPVKNGLALWLDAADDTTFSYSSGTLVSQWRDKSGNNRHFFQATAGNQPSRSAVVNSRKAIQFTAASSQYLRYNSKIINNTTGGSVFVAWRTAGETGAYSSILDNYHCGSNALGAGFQIERNVTNNQYYWGFITSGCSNAGFIPATSYSNDTTNSIWITKDSTTITGGLNGTSTTPASSPSATWIEDDKGWTIGAWGGGTESFGRFFNGINCEVIIFNRGLSPTEVKQVNTYLGQKWGISNADRQIFDLSGNNFNFLFTGTNPRYNAKTIVSNFDTTSPYAVSAFGGQNLTSKVLNLLYSDHTIEVAVNPKGFRSIYSYNNALTTQTVQGVVLWTGQHSGLYFQDTTLYYIYWNTASTTVGISYNAANYQDKIMYITATRTVDTLRLYINGVLVAGPTTVAASTAPLTYTQLNIGLAYFGNPTTQGYVWASQHDYYLVRMYQKQLSDAEVSSNYQSFASRFSLNIVQQGLVLNIDAANPYSYGGAGTTVYDTSNTALSWTTNNTTYNSDPIKYFSYNGSSSWLQSSTSTAYDSQTITMECWFYPTTLTQDGFLFEKGQVNTQYSMFLAFGNTFYFRTIGGTINNQDLTFTTSTYIVANAWNHVVCTYNGSTKIVYVNGIQAASVAASGTLQTGQTNQYIGKYGAAGNNFPFNGRIAESRVYNIALSAAQVLQNYNATKSRFGL